jgi:hypothetical protein
MLTLGTLCHAAQNHRKAASTSERSPIAHIKSETTLRATQNMLRLSQDHCHANHFMNNDSACLKNVFENLSQESTYFMVKNKRKGCYMSMQNR